MSARLSCLALAAAILAPLAPALAQEGTGARISPERPRPAAPREAEPMRVSPAEGIDDPATLLRMARSTLAAGRLAETAELVERAESRLLTRSELASEADRPAMGGAFGDLAAARAALARRDRADADALIGAAIAGLDRGRPPMATGGPAAPPGPASGGGAVVIPPQTAPLLPAPKPPPM